MAERYEALEYRAELQAKLDRIVTISSSRNSNPACTDERGKASVTDRALRYRANACPPPGPRICAFCGSERNVEVGHLDGHEENTAPENLIWTCRSCNVRCGHILRRAGLGRLTRQYNPRQPGAQSLGQYISSVRILRGDIAGDVRAATATVHATTPEQRSDFAREIWAIRRERYGPTGRSDSIPF